MWKWNCEWCFWINKLENGMPYFIHSLQWKSHETQYTFLQTFDNLLHFRNTQRLISVNIEFWQWKYSFCKSKRCLSNTLFRITLISKIVNQDLASLVLKFGHRLLFNRYNTATTTLPFSIRTFCIILTFWVPKFDQEG